MSSTNNASTAGKKMKMPLYKEVDGFRLPAIFSADAYRSALAYKPRPDDLFILTFPKCGTTWVQNIVANIYRKGKPFESALEFFSQTPFLQMTGAEGAEKMKRPGAIKLHLPFRLTPYSPEAKYIFVARNPKDCCVSFFYNTKDIVGYEYEDGNFDDFFELFMEGQTDFGEYYDTLLSWYEHRNDPNVLFITYEGLQKNTVENILRIAEFLGQEYQEMLELDPDMLSLVMHNSSITFMREFFNKSFAELERMPKEFIRNHPDIPSGVKELFGDNAVFSDDASKVNFIRKGIIGDWKNHFSEEQSSRMEAKFRLMTKGTDIPKFWEDCMTMAKDSDS